MTYGSIDDIDNDAADNDTNNEQSDDNGDGDVGSDSIVM